MSDPEDIMIAIADDHELFREGLGAFVGDFKGIKVVIMAENGKALLKKLEQQHSDVVLMDLQMPVMGGVEATTRIRKRYPKMKIIGFSVRDEKYSIVGMIEAGAHGYLVKNADRDELEKAIRAVISNGVHYNQYVTEALFNECHNMGN